MDLSWHEQCGFIVAEFGFIVAQRMGMSHLYHTSASRIRQGERLHGAGKAEKGVEGRADGHGHVPPVRHQRQQYLRGCVCERESVCERERLCERECVRERLCERSLSSRVEASARRCRVDA